MVIQTLLSISLLIIIAGSYSGIKIFIHSFMGFGYRYYLWLNYTIFYFIILSILKLLSYLLNFSLIYNWPFLLGILTLEVLIFYWQYYQSFPLKRYLGFLISSTIFGISLVSLTLATLTLIFSAYWAIFLKFLEGEWF